MISQFTGTVRTVLHSVHVLITLEEAKLQNRKFVSLQCKSSHSQQGAARGSI